MSFPQPPTLSTAVAVAVLILSASAFPIQQHPKMIGALVPGAGGNDEPLHTYITVTQSQGKTDEPIGQSSTSIKDFLFSAASSQSEQTDPTAPMVANYTWVGIGYTIVMNNAALEKVRPLTQAMSILVWMTNKISSTFC